MSGGIKKIAGQLLPIAGVALGIVFPAAAPIIVGASGLLGAYLASDGMSLGDWGAQAKDADLIQSNFKSTQKTIPIVYGKRRVGSNDVFMEMSGEGDNRTMWIVSCLAEGECTSIAVDPETGDDQIYIDSISVAEFNRKHEEKNGVDDIVQYYFHAGTSTQVVDPEINAAIPRFTDAMRNTCYVVWRIKWVKGLFAGMPIRQVVLNGKKVKDVRTGSTVYSTNPALHLYDYITNTRYGLNFTTSWIKTSSFISAANYCDGSGPRLPWKVNYIVASQIKSQSVIDTLLAHFRGNLTWYDGSLYLNYAEIDEEAPAGTITDSDIMRDDAGFDMITVGQPSSFMMPDAALIKYVSEHKNWTLDDVHIGDKLGYTAQYEFPGFTDRKLAVNMGTYMLERTQLNRTYTVKLRSSNIVYEPNDLVYISSTEAGLDNYLCRVIQANIDPDGSAAVTLVAESDTLYNTEYDLDPTAIYRVNIADPSEAPPSVNGITFDEEIYSYRDRSFVRLNVGFGIPVKTAEGLDYPWFDYGEVHISYDGTTFEFLFNAPDHFQIDPIAEGPMWIAIVSVSTYGQKQAFDKAAVAYHRVLGVSEIRPERELDFTVTVTDSTVVVYAPIGTDPDIEGYELRLGNDWYENRWQDASLLTIISNPTVSFTAVKPGQHYLWLDVKGKNGLYSGFASFRGFVIKSPPTGYAQKDFDGPLDPIEISYNGPGHFGTRVVDVGGEDALEVDRGPGGDNKTGYYISPVYNTSSYAADNSAPVVISVSCGTALRGGGTSWEWIAPAGTKWPAIAPSGSKTTWADIAANVEEPSTIEIEAQVSLDGVSDWVSAYGLETVTATVYDCTFMRFVFTITDPLIGSNYTAGPAVAYRYVLAPKIETFDGSWARAVTGITASLDAVPTPP